MYRCVYIYIYICIHICSVAVELRAARLRGDRLDRSPMLYHTLYDVTNLLLV